MTGIDQLIAQAQTLLRQVPFDAAHDFEHHQLVVEHCSTLVDTEQLDLGYDALMTAAWWHDVNKSYKTENSYDETVVFFHENAKKFGVAESFVQQCTTIIREHAFNSEQTSIESQVLFDADKIEYANAERIDKLVVAFTTDQKEYSDAIIQETYDIWSTRLSVLPERFHFETARQLFLHNLPEAQTSLERMRRLIGGRS